MLEDNMDKIGGKAFACKRTEHARLQFMLWICHDYINVLLCECMHGIAMMT
jgi:hypothetical protein